MIRRERERREQEEGQQLQEEISKQWEQSKREELFLTSEDKFLRDLEIPDKLQKIITEEGLEEAHITKRKNPQTISFPKTFEWAPEEVWDAKGVTLIWDIKYTPGGTTYISMAEGDYTGTPVGYPARVEAKFVEVLGNSDRKRLVIQNSTNKKRRKVLREEEISDPEVIDRVLASMYLDARREEINSWPYEIPTHTLVKPIIPEYNATPVVVKPPTLWGRIKGVWEDIKPYIDG